MYQKQNFEVLSEIIQKFLISDQEEIWKVSNNQHDYEYEQNHHQKCKFIIKLWKFHKKIYWHDYIIIIRLLCWLWSNEIEQRIKKYDSISDFIELVENDNYFYESHEFSQTVCASNTVNSCKAYFSWCDHLSEWCESQRSEDQV